MTKVKVGVFITDKTLSYSALGLSDIFTLANYNMNNELFSTDFVSDKKRPITSIPSLTLDIKNITTKKKYDLIIVAPLLGDAYEQVDPKVHKWLFKMAKSGTIMASACAGSFLLAQANIVGNKKTTTHWDLACEFRKKYPKLNLDTSKILLDEGELITAGGVNSYVDLCLHFIQKYAGALEAHRCAQLLVSDNVRVSQQIYNDLSFYPLIKSNVFFEMIEWLKRDLQKKITVSDMAEFCKLGERTFLRKFKLEFNDTPLAFLQKIRVEKAKTLLAIESLSFDEISYRVGFQDTSSFRKLFKKIVELTPSDYKSRLGSK